MNIVSAFWTVFYTQNVEYINIQEVALAIPFQTRGGPVSGADLPYRWNTSGSWR